MKITNNPSSSQITAVVISQPENKSGQKDIVPTFSIERKDGASTRFLMEDIVKFMEDAQKNNLLTKDAIKRCVKNCKGLKSKGRTGALTFTYTPPKDTPTKEVKPSFRYLKEYDWVKTNTKEKHPDLGVGMVQLQTSYSVAAVSALKRSDSSKKGNLLNYANGRKL